MARLDSIRRLEDELLAQRKAELNKIFGIDTINGWKKWATIENYTYGKNRGSMTMIVELQALHPYFRDQVIELINRCEKKGIQLAVVETYRTYAKQNEYKSMGKKYTRSGGGKSKHQYGLAIDLVPIVGGKPQWNNKYLWRRIGVAGEQLGLRWGGRWRSLYDPGHFEWTGGLESEELTKGLSPRIPNQETKYPCIDEDLRLLARYWKSWDLEQASLARGDIE